MVQPTRPLYNTYILRSVFTWGLMSPLEFTMTNHHHAKRHVLEWDFPSCQGSVGSRTTLEISGLTPQITILFLYFLLLVFDISLMMVMFKVQAFCLKQPPRKNWWSKTQTLKLSCVVVKYYASQHEKNASCHGYHHRKIKKTKFDYLLYS